MASHRVLDSPACPAKSGHALIASRTVEMTDFAVPMAKRSASSCRVEKSWLDAGRPELGCLVEDVNTINGIKSHRANAPIPEVNICQTRREKCGISASIGDKLADRGFTRGSQAVPR